MTKINEEESEIILIRLYNIRLRILLISDACTFLYGYNSYCIVGLSSLSINTIVSHAITFIFVEQSF